MIEPGQKAPAFALTDQDGREHRLADYRDKWVVLYFYPKDNTSGCTKEACAFQAARRKLSARGAAVLGVSPDDEKSHRNFVEKHALTFPLLADPGVAVCRKYGVWQEKRNYGRVYMGVVRTTYLIDPTGRVAHRFDRVRVTGHDEAVMAQLDALKQAHG